MKNISMGLFCSLIISLLFSAPPVKAQVGSETYQRVMAGSAPESSKPVEKSTKKKSKKGDDLPPGLLTIDENEELTFPAGMKECKVYDSRSLERAVLLATWKGQCEWIVLRNPTDWDEKAAMFLQMDKPLVLADMHPSARGHPLVITNDTGRAIVFKTPKNGGCTIIMKKPDTAVMGFMFEGAVCH